ncbi:hypothetical protein N0V90_010199 [Kalmusia sp. IMI 367209]|nr:hypothetical protein N0V90_010199 [Kalmusia sp. IMI 367209]
MSGRLGASRPAPVSAVVGLAVPDSIKDIQSNNIMGRKLEKLAEEKRAEYESLSRSVVGRLEDEKPYLIDHSWIQDQIDSAIDNGKKLREKRKKLMSKRIGDTLVNFANEFRPILVGYTDMIAVVNGAVPRFGQLAYGSLSVLLQVGINKRRREDLIMSTLNDISTAMPRIRAYELMQSKNERMLNHLVNIYAAALTFPMAATEYFLRSSSRRIYMAIVRPEPLLKEQVEHIKKLIEDLSHEAITVVSGIVIDKERMEHHKRVRSLCRIFSLGNKDNEAPILSDMSQLLEGKFSKSPRRARLKDVVLAEITAADLQQLPQYRDWLSSPHSSLLLLSGKNYDMYTSGRGLCWLSPVIPLVISALSSPQPRAIYSAKRRLGPEQSTAFKALSTIMFQIMAACPEVCNTMCDAIEYEFRNKEWRSQSIQAITQRIIDAIEASSHTEFFLLLDRIDLLEDMGVPDFIREVLQLFAGHGKAVKVLATADSARWRREEKLLAEDNGRSLRYDLKPNQLLLKLAWDQTVRAATNTQVEKQI